MLKTLALAILAGIVWSAEAQTITRQYFTTNQFASVDGLAGGSGALTNNGTGLLGWHLFGPDWTNTAGSYSNSLWLAASNLTWVATNNLSTGAFTSSNSLWVAASNLAWVATNNLGSAAFVSSNTFWLSSSNLAFQATNGLTTGAFTPSNTAWLNSSNLVWQGTNGLGTAAFASSNTLWLNSSNLSFQVTNGLSTGAFTSSNSLWLNSSNLAWQATNGLATGAFTSSNSLWLNSSNLVFQGTNALGSAAWTASSAYDVSGAAQTATNSITSAWVQGKFPGLIVTNGETQAITVSNVWRVDAANAFYPSNATASRMAMVGADNSLTNAGATGSASPINRDGSATTSSQVNALFPGNILTNGNSFAATFSNIFTIDAAHYVTGPASFSTITNTGLTSADTVATDSNGKLIQATAISMGHITQPGVILTNGGTTAVTYSNILTVDATHYFSGPGSFSTITNTGLTSANAIATDSNGKNIAATAAGLQTVVGGSFATNQNATLTSGRLLAGDGARGVQLTDLSGDVTTSGSAATTIAAQSVTAVANNTGGWTEYKVSGSDFTRTAQTLADVTGLVSGTLSTSSVYDFDAFLLVTSSSSAGVQFGVNCTGSGATVGAVFEGATLTTAATNTSVSSLSSAANTPFCTGSQTSTVRIYGFINSGTGSPALSIQCLKTTSGTATVKVGSVLRVRKM